MSKLRSARDSDRVEELLAQLAALEEHEQAQRKQLRVFEAELTKTLTEYREFSEMVSAAQFTLDGKGRIGNANLAAAKLLRKSTEELDGASFTSFVARESLRPYLDHLTGAIFSGTAATTTLHLNVEGTDTLVQISTKHSRKALQIFRVMLVDISNVEKTQHELRELLAHWQSVVHNAPDPLMKVSADGRIALVSREFSGFRPEDIVDRSILSLFPPETHAVIRNCLDTVFHRSEAVHCDIQTGKDNSARWYSLRFAPVMTWNSQEHHDEKGRTTAAIVIIRDITDQINYQHQIETSREHLRHLSARMDTIREEERIRLSREIHDQLGQALTALKIDLAWLQKEIENSPRAVNRLQEMATFTDGIIEAVRQISSDLRPSALDELGLVPAVEWHVREFQKRSGIRCRFRTSGDVNANADQATGIFRVVQEALTNVARHAQATRVTVSLTTRGNELLVAVSDNGKGIRPDQLTPNSLGILGMRERVARLGGTINFSAGRKGGTTVCLHIPKRVGQSLIVR